jgi:peptide deformylase
MLISLPDHHCFKRPASMTVRPIVKLPDPVLKKVSDPVERVDDELRGLVDDMLETMYDAPGIGLAAIQIGIPRRLLVIDLAKEDQPKDPHAFINPEIVWSSDDTSVYEEGCLSIPDVFYDVERPAEVKVRYHRPGRQAAGDGLLRPDGDLHPARDRPSQRRTVHRPSVPAQAVHGGAQVHQDGPSAAGNGVSLRCIFMGTPEFSVPTLARMIDDGHNVSASTASRRARRAAAWPSASLRFTSSPRAGASRSARRFRCAGRMSRQPSPRLWLMWRLSWPMA